MKQFKFYLASQLLRNWTGAKLVFSIADIFGLKLKERPALIHTPDTGKCVNLDTLTNLHFTVDSVLVQQLHISRKINSDGSHMGV